MKLLPAKAFLFLGFFFLFTTAYAKYNYKPGYIITTNNDTIRGLIDFGSATHNTAHCVFRKDTSSTATDYSPTELNGYGFSFNRHFLSKKVKLDSTSAPRSFFMEHLVNGVVDLYFADDIGTTHFFIEQNNVMYELKNEEVKIVENNITYTKRSEAYKRSLKYLLQDVPAISSDIDHTAFTRKALIALLEKYHKNGKMQSVTYHDLKIKAPHEKWVFHFGFNLGLNHSNLSVSSAFNGIDKYVFPAGTGTITADAIIYESNMPGITAQTVSRPTQSSNNLFPGLTLGFRSGKNSVEMDINYFKNTFDFKDFTIRTKKLVIPISYKRTFTFGRKIAPFVQGGLCINYNLKTEVDYMYLNYSAPDENGYNFKYVYHSEGVSEQNSSLKKSVWGTGVIVGAGIGWDLGSEKRLEFGVSYFTLSNSFHTDFDYHIHVRTSLFYLNSTIAFKFIF